MRGYVQLETPTNAVVVSGFNLQNELRDGTKVDTGYLAVTPPQWLGPTIVAPKDKPVRIVFYNLLPTGADGDLFLPTNSSLMGSGMGPMDMGAPMDQGSVMDMVRNPMCIENTRKDAMRMELLQGQPRYPAPARRHHALDQRRHRPPVDHPGWRETPCGRRVSVSRMCPTC